MFPKHEVLVATLLQGSLEQSFVMEFILKSVLIFVILLMSEGSKETGKMIVFTLVTIVAFEAILQNMFLGYVLLFLILA